MSEKYNEFRQMDALEYASAYTTGLSRTPSDIKEHLRQLDIRIKNLFDRTGQKPSNLLAAYRGWEDALSWLEMSDEEQRRKLGHIVVLDQS